MAKKKKKSAKRNKELTNLLISMLADFIVGLILLIIDKIINQ